MRGRFLKHVVGNLKKHKTTEEKMVEADKKSGRTWKQCVEYLGSEDEDILDFIVETQAFSRTGGEALFKEMAAQKVVEGRTWGSLQKRFIHIKKNLNDYDFLTEEQKTCLRERKSIFDEDGKLAAGQTRKNQTFSEAEDRALLGFIIDKQAYSRVGSRSLYKAMAKAGVVQGRTWKSLKNRFQSHISKKIDSFGLTAQQVADFKNKTIPAGQTRKNQKYSVEEDKELLKYIVKKRAYNEVGGRTLWKKMEKKELANGRPWESMRNRFKRTLIKNIKAGKENYGLTEQEISRFRGEGKVEDGGEKEGESTDSDDDEEEEEMDIEVEEEEGGIDEPEVEEKDDEKGKEGDEQGENEEEVDRPRPSRILVDF